MKRLILLVLALILVFSLASCESCNGDDTDTPGGGGGGQLGGGDDDDIKINEDGSIDLPIIPINP